MPMSMVSQLVWLKMGLMGERGMMVMLRKSDAQIVGCGRCVESSNESTVL